MTSGRDKERSTLAGAQIKCVLLCSVVIPNHNYVRYLPGCLDSLLAQGIPSQELEVVLVDDASDDGSAAVARRLLTGMGLGAWRVLELPRQGRPGPVRNAGLELAQGEYLLCLDPDDRLLPGFLSASLAALEATGADIAYCGMVIEETAASGATAEGAGRTTRREVAAPDYSPLLLANQNFLPSACLMRRGVWQAGARYRDQTGYEDWDFWVQAALLGARFTPVQRFLFLHCLRTDGYFASARQRDGESKARIVLENPAFFPAWTRAWARGLLRGEPWADPFGRGLIPVLREHVPLPQAGRAKPTPWTEAPNLPTLQNRDGDAGSGTPLNEDA